MALTKVRGGGVDNPLTLGGGAASDRSIIFDGNAQDFHIGLDDSTDSLTIGLGSTLGTTSHMVIDANGHITKPLQSAFLAYVGTATRPTNIAPDTSTAIVFNTEIFDQNADFNTSNGKFVAPVTGKYQLNFKAYLQDVPSDPEYIYIQLITSNRNYIHIFDPRGFDTGVAYHHAEYSMLVDMDANDEASVLFYQRLGSQTTDFASGTNNDPNTNFSGYLVC